MARVYISVKDRLRIGEMLEFDEFHFNIDILELRKTFFNLY